MEDTHKFPRLYIQAGLSAGGGFPLPDAQAHYARNVMRLCAGDNLRVFNGVDGEYLARISSADKKNVVVTLEKQLKPQPAKPAATHLIFAPIKKTQMEWMIEKAVELGVTDFHPVLTQHTELRQINAERLTAQVIEAAEQCERLDIPALHPLAQMTEKLRGWTGPKILAGIERAGAQPLTPALINGDAAFLVGPEGGFSSQEKDLLAKSPAIIPVSLGSLILRAETAALKMLSLRP